MPSNGGGEFVHKLHMYNVCARATAQLLIAYIYSKMNGSSDYEGNLLNILFSNFRS